MVWEVAGRLSGPAGATVYRGPSHKKAVAITFDDGPSESTPELLGLLARYKVQATFFQCGVNVRRLPEVARAVVEGAHEVGNHSDSHRSMLLRSKSFMSKELGRAQESIVAATGRRPVLFRPPYGHLWFGLGEVERRLGLTGVMWTTIGWDWKHSAARVLSILRRGCTNGAIFCLHDGRSGEQKPDITNTLEAVRRFVPELLAQGFRFETVSQLLRG
jgi:peptidoglycan-N-acetylglucosamine deacetylase